MKPVKVPVGPWGKRENRRELREHRGEKGGKRGKRKKREWEREKGEREIQSIKIGGFTSNLKPVKVPVGSCGVEMEIEGK